MRRRKRSRRVARRTKTEALTEVGQPTTKEKEEEESHMGHLVPAIPPIRSTPKVAGRPYYSCMPVSRQLHPLGACWVHLGEVREGDQVGV